MKNTLIKTSLVAAMIAGLAACSSVTPPNQSGMTTARNAAIGAAVGAAAGNLWGKDTEATLTGAAIGGLIGSQVRTPDGSGYNNGGYAQPQQPAYNGGYGYPQQQPTYNNGGYNNGGYYNGGYGR